MQNIDIEKIANEFENIYHGNEQLINREAERKSKIYGIDKDIIIKEARKFYKEKKYGKQRRMIKFYHTTSSDNIEKVLNDEELLSASERIKKGENYHENSAKNSLNHGVQFTFDNYQDGKLISSGYNQGFGAKGNDITFVFGDELLDDELFDPFGMYPSISHINLNKCLAIICTNKEEKNMISRKLTRYKLNNIIVLMENEFDPSIYSSKLEVENMLNELENVDNKMLRQ